MKEQSSSPGYVAVLNSVAQVERRAHDFYLAWADHTPDAELERVMRAVALREIEHAYAFQKRIAELGSHYQDDAPNPFLKQCDEWLELFSSDASDLDKFRGFGFKDPEKLPNDDFADFFKDTTLDRETGALLGRYIAEERESATMFLKVYARMLKENA
jgi:hypothetical protein